MQSSNNFYRLFFMEVIMQGFITGILLSVAIGAQSTFVLQQGLSKQYLLMTVLVCWIADSLLFALGVLGVGEFIAASSFAISIMTWAAVAFLVGYGLIACIGAIRMEPISHTNNQDSTKSRSGTLIMLLIVTFLNPHVYLDSLVILPGITAGFPLADKIYFVTGAALAALIWLSSLVFSVSRLAPLFKKPVTRRIIGFVIGLAMFWIAWCLI